MAPETVEDLVRRVAVLEQGQADQKKMNLILAERIAGLISAVEAMRVRLDVLATPAVDLGAIALGGSGADPPFSPATQLKIDGEFHKSIGAIAELLTRHDRRLTALEKGWSDDAGED